MKTEIKAIKALLLEKEEGLTISGIAKKTGSDYRIVHTAVSRLLKKGIVEKRNVGKSAEIKLKKRFSKEVFEAENERREELVKNKGMKVLYEKLGSLPFPLIALVFGSYSKGNAKRGSDIDLMVICPADKADHVENLISLMPLDIHLTVLKREEFLEMAKSKGFNVVNEAMKNNIILIGIEEYYRLVENAG